MKVDKVVRAALALFFVALLVVAIAGSLFVTESALNIWARLHEGPTWVRYAWLGVVVTAIGACLWAIWRFVVPRKNKTGKRQRKPLSESDLQTRIDTAAQSGADVQGASAELAELARRREDNTVHICVFGEVSAGKSSLIQALLPGAEVAISPVAGSTSAINEYRWDSGGNGVLLTDVPGTAAASDNLDAVAREAALRSHVVLYVCEGDLNRHQQGSLRELAELDKPTIVVLNKSDRYDRNELKQLRKRLGEHVAELGKASLPVVSVAAGGTETVTRIDAAGQEEQVERQRRADLAALKLAVRELLTRDPNTLHLLRDQAVFALADEKLRAAENDYRLERAEAIVSSYTKKAVVGALAAISPGSDVIIQGFLGTTMTRDLCALWGVSARDMDIEQFLNLSQSRVGRALPLSLAVAGNGLKAFPGIGTVAGGLVHAVAYGLIFDALGRSLALTLAERGAFEPDAAAASFEDNLNEHLEKNVRRVARIALNRPGEHD